MDGQALFSGSPQVYGRRPRERPRPSVMLSVALRRHVSSRQARNVRKKEYCTAMACEDYALGFTHTQNPRKHCVSSKKLTIFFAWLAFL